MRSFIKYCFMVLIAALLGAGSAFYWLLKPPFDPSWVRNGAWKTNLLAGSERSGMYDRARVALAGLFALKRSETLYYIADVDDNGKPLRSERCYRVEGRNLDSRWWSITVYGQTYFLIPNDQKRYSFNKNNVSRDADGRFRIHLSSMPKGKNWIPTGGTPQNLHLNLRLYNPSVGVSENPGEAVLPRIIREECR
ncbi:MAG: DUF1214 domain-containing protein [Deltaproteobacteria bacterium]|nr:DUF1214 domain-containing protein [Deltaproteobacteria bacterium]